MDTAFGIVNDYRGRNYLWGLNNYDETPDTDGNYKPVTVLLDASTAGNMMRYLNDCPDQSKINVEALRQCFHVDYCNDNTFTRMS